MILDVGDRFQLGSYLVYTVEAVHPVANRYDLSVAYDRHSQRGTVRWSISYVAHLVTSGKVTTDVVDRCQLCGDPDDAEMMEAVFNERHYICHVSCAEARAAQRGKTLTEVMA